jgi:hypothetical protein
MRVLVDTDFGILSTSDMIHSTRAITYKSIEMVYTIIAIINRFIAMIDGSFFNPTGRLSATVPVIIAFISSVVATIRTDKHLTIL